jgi:hypothetical protein
MSKLFLGLSFTVAGLALLIFEMVTQFATPCSLMPLGAGTLLGSGGVLFIWAITDHLTINHVSHLPK